MKIFIIGLLGFNNILDINKLIQNKKKLIEEFCHCIEKFIFINVKNNKQIKRDNFDIYGNKFHEFYNNNINDNLKIKDLSHNISSQIQNNSYNSSPFV